MRVLKLNDSLNKQYTICLDCIHYTLSHVLSGRLIAIQWSPAVGRVVGYIASNWSLQHNFHNFAAWHIQHRKNAQPMTRATGDNKDHGNAQRNKEQRPYESNVQLGNRAFDFSRAMTSICYNACQSGCSRWYTTPVSIRSLAVNVQQQFSRCT